VAETGQLVVALEMLGLPLWVGAVGVPPPTGRVRRLIGAVAPVGLVAVGLLLAGAIADGPVAATVLRTQTLAVGFALLLAGLAAFLDRLAGPRAAQFLTTILGWTLVAAVIPAGPVAGVLDDPLKTALVRLVVHADPLVVAERELGLAWLHQGLTYRWTGLGESYGYLVGHLAWWKTFLAHVFVGSGLAVFSLRRVRAI